MGSERCCEVITKRLDLDDLQNKVLTPEPHAFVLIVSNSMVNHPISEADMIHRWRYGAKILVVSYSSSGESIKVGACDGRCKRAGRASGANKRSVRGASDVIHLRVHSRRTLTTQSHILLWFGCNPATKKERITPCCYALKLRIKCATSRDCTLSYGRDR